VFSAVDLKLAVSEPRPTSYRLKSADAFDRSVPPTAVSLVVAVEVVALPTRGNAPHHEGFLLSCLDEREVCAVDGLSGGVASAVDSRMEGIV
jgi:hypothetical protein